MKQPKKLTRDQKKLVSSLGLKPGEWMCLFEDGEYLHLTGKNSEEIKIIDKNRKSLC